MRVSMIIASWKQKLLEIASNPLITIGMLSNSSSPGNSTKVAADKFFRITEIARVDLYVDHSFTLS